MITYKGFDAYAGLADTFPVKRFLEQFPERLAAPPAIAVLSGSFGRNPRLIRAYEKRFAGQPHMIETYISNGCARRRARIEKGDFLPAVKVAEMNQLCEAQAPKLRRALKRRMVMIEEVIISQAPTATHVLTLELEDNLTSKAAESFYELLLQHKQALEAKYPLATFRICRNPLRNSTSVAALYERHTFLHAGNPGEIINTDGYSLSVGDGARFFQQFSIAQAQRLIRDTKAFALLLWSARTQGYPNLQDWSQTPPKDGRKFEVSDEQVEIGQWLLRG